MLSGRVEQSMIPNMLQFLDQSFITAITIEAYTLYIPTHIYLPKFV